MGDQEIPIEQELIKRLKNRDIKALDYLYDTYSSVIYNFVRRIVKIDSLAEEVLHDSFIRIWHDLEVYDSRDGKLFTWMLKISANVAIDYLKSEKFKSPQNFTFLSFKNLNIFHSLKLDYSRLKMASLLRILAKDQLVLIDLIYLKGHTQIQVSKELNIPLKTVKLRVKKAMDKLRGLATQRSEAIIKDI